jgi:hypothetical protein
VPKSHPATPSTTLPPVATFVDAMSQLMAFEEEFGRCQAALIVDDDGTVRDGVVLTRRRNTADDVLTYLLAGAVPPGRRRRHVLLFSVMGKVDIRVLGESDVDAYRALAVRCEDAGAVLADWLIAGGDLYRSMQLTLADSASSSDADWTLSGAA